MKFKPTHGAVFFAWIYAISPTWLNDFRVNATRFAYSTLESRALHGINFGLPYVYIEGFPGGVPNLNHHRGPQRNRSPHRRREHL